VWHGTLLRVYWQPLMMPEPQMAGNGKSPWIGGTRSTTPLYV
jgi:hypothetical protein